MEFCICVSLQLMPTFVHKKAVDQMREDNDQFALGIGGCFKITRSVCSREKNDVPVEKQILLLTFTLPEVSHL